MYTGEEAQTLPLLDQNENYYKKSVSRQQNLVYSLAVQSRPIKLIQDKQNMVHLYTATETLMSNREFYTSFLSQFYSLEYLQALTYVIMI